MLKRTRQTELSIKHFWNPILMATLNDRAAHCSTRYAGKVFHELFIKSSTGGRLGIPTVPLSDFYMAAARLIESRGGRVQLRGGPLARDHCRHGVRSILYRACASIRADTKTIADHSIG
jgi:hypothetical protein